VTLFVSAKVLLFACREAPKVESQTLMQMQINLSRAGGKLAVGDLRTRSSSRKFVQMFPLLVAKIFEDGSVLCCSADGSVFMTFENLLLNCTKSIYHK